MIAVERFPAWLKQEVPDMNNIRPKQKIFRESGLHTVCESARCPNMGSCWNKGIATFIILGDICPRGCRFCAVLEGQPIEVDLLEPKKVAETIQKLGLKYVVITSVSRDDLSDGGAGIFAQTIFNIRRISPEVKIEVLIPDFSGQIESLRIVLEVEPQVLSHNIETAARLFKVIRPKAGYDRSLNVLRNTKKLRKSTLVKSGFMVGLGETLEEIKELMHDLVDAGCDILTIGQYLAPTKSIRHIPVNRFVSPEEFESYRALGLSLGFKHVMSAPLVRSSYMAEQSYQNLAGYQKNNQSLELAKG